MAETGREFFTARTVAQARAEFRPSHRTGAERVGLDAACGRVPFAEILAEAPLPGFDRSAVDGFAVRARDTFGASEAIPAYLQVTGAVRMGAAAEAAVGGQAAVAVPTGGALPDGADAVVMVEHTQQAMPGTIEVVRPVAPGEGLVRADEDVTAGTAIAAADRPLRAQDVALLAACGVVERDVHALPRVAIIATGDEVVSPAVADLGPGQVRDALSAPLGALVREAGGMGLAGTIVPDDRDALHGALRRALDGCDAVVVCAGSSVGARDETAAAIELAGAEIWCHGLAIKPGKPTLLAARDGVPVIGLPGNPRSALVVFRLLGMDLVRRAGGWTAEHRAPSVPATLGRNLPSAAGRLDVVQVALEGDVARPIFGPSALLSVLTAADGYLIVPEDANGLAAGEPVRVFTYG
ncbi:MAG: molybdopterin molybdotransferase MoeA [Solirubrobacteraceae bacterium]